MLDFPPENITDNDPGSYWIANRMDIDNKVIIELSGSKTFDRIMLREPILIGQRISRFHIEVETSNGEWEQVASGTTIGYKRILRVEPVTTSKIKLVIEASNHLPAIAHIGVFRASALELGW